MALVAVALTRVACKNFVEVIEDTGSTFAVAIKTIFSLIDKDANLSM